MVNIMENSYSTYDYDVAEGHKHCDGSMYLAFRPCIGLIHIVFSATIKSIHKETESIGTTAFSCCSRTWIISTFSTVLYPSVNHHCIGRA